MPLHVSSTMCSSSGGQNCIIQHLVSSYPRWSSGVQVERRLIVIKQNHYYKPRFCALSRLITQIIKCVLLLCMCIIWLYVHVLSFTPHYFRLLMELVAVYSKLSQLKDSNVALFTVSREV